MDNNKVYPRELKELATTKSHKSIFWGEFTPLRPSDCDNCGGMGFMSCFIAYVGPFNHTPAEHKLSIHWDNGKWWIGQAFSAPCPVCVNK
jgi:hypothetical protein